LASKVRQLSRRQLVDDFPKSGVGIDCSLDFRFILRPNVKGVGTSAEINCEELTDVPSFSILSAGTVVPAAASSSFHDAATHQIAKT
jgi:hypothetical protein